MNKSIFCFTFLMIIHFTCYTQDTQRVIFKHQDGKDILTRGPLTATYNLETGQFTAVKKVGLQARDGTVSYYPKDLNNAHEIYYRLFEEYERGDLGPVEHFSSEKEPDAFYFRNEEPLENEN